MNERGDAGQRRRAVVVGLVGVVAVLGLGLVPAASTSGGKDGSDRSTPVIVVPRQDVYPVARLA